ncbi:MAG TPA: endopeptidase La [Ruminococcaceae bacterium]|mgnify:FL=1|nr:endopeptidase La [Oscillospiraceae bacterium]
MSTVVENKIEIMPVLALRGLVVFPGTVISFDVARKKSVAAVKYAAEHGGLLYAAAQREVFVEDPKEEDLYPIGCVVRVRQVLKISDNTVKVLVDGLYRAKAGAVSFGAFLSAGITRLEDKPIKNRPVYLESLIRRIRTQFEKYVEVYSNMAPDVVMQVAVSDDVGKLADFIASSVPAPYDDKQYILEQTDPVRRAKILIEMLDKEREIGEIDRRIGEKTKAAIDENQREYYLREQIKAISSELYGDDTADEIDEYHMKVEALNADSSVKEALHKEVNKLAKMPGGAHEGTVVRGYLDTCLELPWNNYTKVSADIKRAAKILDRDIYGMNKVKERILEMLSVYALAPDIKGQIICLAGPPGVGKTSIGKTVAECMGRKFARISLGGVHDEAEIRGHRKTYIGAMPGKIIDAVRRAGSGNPLILLDEVDKLGSDYKGDPSSALLEVLDPEQNGTFTDNFIEIPYDLSHTVFIATANDLSTVPAPLLDRMEVIEIPSYTREEKLNIAKYHLVRKQEQRHGLNGRTFKITDGAIYSLIDFYTREAGVRRLERTIAALCRKSAKLIAEGSEKRVTVNAETVEKMLGHKRYKPEQILSRDEVGIINGLAWTSVGGEIMQLEVAVMEGTGKIELTGSLGDVMKESAMAAVSYVRSNAERFNIDTEFYKKLDIHIHATEAAVPKDGPSAGVAITTGLVSALTGRAVKRDVAMTGEVTVRGRVLPIGGLREKSMAAYTGGVKTVFIPADNVADLDDVDDIVKQNVSFIPVSFVDEIIEKALDAKKESAALNGVYSIAVSTDKHERISQ